MVSVCSLKIEYFRNVFPVTIETCKKLHNPIANMVILKRNLKGAIGKQTSFRRDCDG